MPSRPRSLPSWSVPRSSSSTSLIGLDSSPAPAAWVSRRQAGVLAGVPTPSEPTLRATRDAGERDQDDEGEYDCGDHGIRGRERVLCDCADRVAGGLKQREPGILERPADTLELLQRRYLFVCR